MNHVPYKSSGQVIMDVVAGHVDMAFDNIPTVSQQAKADKVRALAVTSLERAPLMPDLPPLAEFLPGFEATSWHGLFAPAGTPPEIVNKLSVEVQRIMKLPAMQEKLQGMGAKPIGSTPEEFAQFIAAERAKWTQVIKDANISME
jgi:tripartite-type tricarboxylate transporter receptor subunit TctC